MAIRGFGAFMAEKSGFRGIFRPGMAINATLVVAPLLAAMPAVPLAAAPARAALVRTIALPETGQEDALVFTDLTGRQALTFRVGERSDIAAITLAMPFAVEGDGAASRTLSIRAGGRVIARRALQPGERGLWQVAVPADAAANGYLTLDLGYVGTLAPGRCHSAGADRVTIAPSAALRVTYADGAAGNARRALAMAPRAVSIALPARPRENQVAAALLLAAARPARFAGPANASDPDEKGWSRGEVRFDAAAPALALDRAFGHPVFVLGGNDPRGTVALFDPARPLSPIGGGGGGGGVQALSLAAAGTTSAMPDRLPLGAGGAGMAPQAIAGRGGWTFYLSASHLPAGHRLERLVADLALDRAGGDAPAIATIALNGQVLGSRTVRPGTSARLAATVPEGLATTTNRIDVSVLRHEVAGDCAHGPARQVARLAASSHVALAPADAPTDFRDLPALLAGGVTLVLPDAPSGQTVGALSGLLTGMLGAATPLAVRYGTSLPASGAVIWVADKAPPGLAAPIPLDRYGARIRDVEGATLVAASAIQAMTLVQLLHHGERPVLWVRPGRDFAALARLPAGAELGYGDVALYDAQGRAFAMSTERERLVRIDHEGDFDLAAWMAANRVWLVLGAWLAITALFAWLLRQTCNARRDRLESDDD